MIVTIVVASLCLIAALAITAAAGIAPFGVGLLLALLPLGVWIPVVLWLDRLEPEPPVSLVVAFLWGAGIATLFAMLLNTAGLRYVAAPAFGEEVGWYVVASFGAPVVEELLKGAVLFGMLWFRRHEINGWTDGVIYAAMVALGFAAVENVTYFVTAGLTGTLAGTFVLRALVTPLLHPLCTALTGIGVAAAAISPRGSARRVLAPLGGLLGAMALHALWNGSTGFGYLALGFAYLVGMGVLATIIVLLVRDRRRTVATISHQLGRYLPTGLVTPADLTMLSTLKARGQARAWAQRSGGAGAARAMRDYQQAATELALLHDRVARGATGPGEVEARRQALLHLMDVARRAFLARVPQSPGPSDAMIPGAPHPGSSTGW
ncbi:PrsW family intramembrane metalloprotease [Cellulosimicrobium terreum]|nr:PrsW family intramembrane metalloprotease [Cellulosimicrobium terreum]